MNAVRHIQLRWINADRLGMPPRARKPVSVALLCVAVFAGCFALGRATLSAGAAQPTTSPGLPITYTGAAVPTRLGGAPAIEAIASSSLRSASRLAAAAGANTTSASTPAAQVQPQGSSTLTATPSPAATVTPPPAARVAPAPATGAPTHHSQPHAGGSVSFDSSG
jgi:hypothetical protein